MRLTTLKSQAFTIFIAACVALSVWHGFQKLQREQLAAATNLARLQAMDKLVTIARSLETEIQDTVKYSDFLGLVIELNPNISEAELHEYAVLTSRQNPSIAGVSFAPDAVIRQTYPEERHAPSLGHDLLEDPGRRPYVLKSMANRSSVLQGPVNAVQGGYYIFNRRAVFVRDADNEERFWGLTIIILDFDRLIDLHQQHWSTDYRYSLTARNGAGNTVLLWGDAGLGQANALRQAVILPDTRWELALSPVDGWAPAPGRLAGQWFPLIITMLVFLLVLFSGNSYLDKRRKARTDPLTGSLNHEALQMRVETLVRRRKPFAMLLVDLDGFKAINDAHGHYVGDKVLIEVCNRIRNVLRRGDDVSRFGGDEFLIVLAGDEMDTQLVRRRVTLQLNTPMDLEGLRLNVRASVGCVVYDSGQASYESLYQAADREMYSMKSSRRMGRADVD